MTYVGWLVAISLAFVALERIAPRERRPFFHRGLATDLTYVVFNGHYFGVLVAWASAPLVLALGLSTPAVIGHWPPALQFVVALVAIDLLQWCVHNLMHRVPFLWRFHRVHHSVTALDWMVSLRFHAVEGVVYKVLTYPLLALLGASQGVLLTLAVFTTAVGHFNHANIAVRTGPLRYVLNSPAMHGWHHAAPNRARPCNFGITLSVWDWLFGTAWMPENPPTELGLGVPFPRTFLGQLVRAFESGPDAASAPAAR